MLFSHVQHTLNIRERLTPLYIDNHLLVIQKNAGELSQADRTGDRDMLSDWKQYIKNRFKKPGNVFLGLVHRLDRPVSGVMVFARTSKSAARLSEQFRTQTVDKKYMALVEGRPGLSGTMEDHLLKTGRRVKSVAPGKAGAKKARLSFRTLAESGGISLVEINLETGRAHQIRVQFSSRGFPLVGDMKYGASSEFDGKNLALHAFSLSFDHPTLKDRLVFNSPLPATWPDLFRDIADSVQMKS